jgi:hypothetical protein
MKRLIIFGFLFLFNVQFLLAENIDLEVYLADDYKGDVNLIVDRKELGTIPIVIKNLDTGHHYFKIRWVDKSGKSCTKFENINITSQDKRLYLTTIKIKGKNWKPILLGVLGGGLILWLLISN